MHHTPSNEESIVEGVIFYSEGRGRADQNRAPNDGQDPDSIKNQIKDRKEGIVRINIDELIENTDLSFSGKEDIARQVYIKVVDLDLKEALAPTSATAHKLPMPATA